MGAFVSILLTGLVIHEIGFETVYLIYALLIFGAVLLFTRLPPTEANRRKINIRNILAVTKDRNLWLLVPAYFGIAYCLGLSFSTLPLLLESRGLTIVGILTSLFSITPILVSVTIGKISDLNHGLYRKQILIGLLIAGVVSAMILLLSSSLWLIALAVILLAILFSGGAVVGYGLIGETFAQEDWESVQGVLNVFNGIGITLPLLSEQIFPRENTLQLEIVIFSVAIVSLLFLERKRREALSV